MAALSPCSGLEWFFLVGIGMAAADPSSILFRRGTQTSQDDDYEHDYNHPTLHHNVDACILFFGA